MDAKSQTCAYQEEGTIMTSFVQFIVLENAQILSSCALEVPTLMVARNLIHASVEVQSLVVATKVICVPVIALLHVDSMNLNVPVNLILAIAVKLKKYAGSRPKTSMAKIVLTILIHMAAQDIAMSSMEKFFVQLMKTI